MAFHAFSFPDPVTNEDAQRNWRVLSEGTKIQVYTPTFNGVLNGVPAAAQPPMSLIYPIGTYTFYGPKCFVHIEFQMPVNYHWLANTFAFSLPTGAQGVNGVPHTHYFALIDASRAVAAVPALNSWAKIYNTVTAANAFVADAVNIHDVYIDFWYYRT